MSSYAHPQTLVDTAWVDEHRDEDLRVVEIDVDRYSYEEGHIPGATAWDWSRQLADQRTRDILSKAQFEALMGNAGITPESTVILYGDNNNWFAAWALWQMKIYGHKDVRLMNGGRKKWLAEGRPLTLEEPKIARAKYVALDADTSLRGLLASVRERVAADKIHLVDVRSGPEFTGEILAPPGLPETCQRGGHIPGASNIPWGMVCNDDGTFKSRDELVALYREQGVTGERPVVTYCRIGERSSHSWFALKYLIGWEAIENYDGSWTEWGNLVGAAIER